MCTHAFRVRYCDEEVALRLLARFRVELRLLAAAEELECEDVILEVSTAHGATAWAHRAAAWRTCYSY